MACNIADRRRDCPASRRLRVFDIIVTPH